MRSPIFASALLALILAALAQARPFTVVAYNVENLFDVDGVSAYEEYQPAAYTPAHALTKLRNIAKVVARFEGGRGPDILMMCELEMDATPGAKAPDYDAILARFAGVKLADMLGARFTREIGDLPAEALLLKALADAGVQGYHVALGDESVAPGSERKQAITCAIFTRFPIKAVRLHPTLNARAILEVQVDVDGAPLTLFANHWKSGAGDPETEPTRAANARTLRTRIDELLRADPNADIIVGGDFNSQYNQRQRYPKMPTTGLNDVLGSQGNELAVRQTGRPLYNLWYELPAEQRGSDTYRGEWGTLMHLMITRGLYDFRGVQYVDNSFTVAKFPGLNADAQGLPVRWTFDGRAGAGFSDHFPVAARFTTVTDGRADRYLALQAPSEGADPANAAVKIARVKVDVEQLALMPSAVAAGTDIRTAEFKGKLFQVEGRVLPGSRLAVQFRGETFEVWIPEESLRNQVRAAHREGSTLRFYGELGQYKGVWQFVIKEAEWVK